MKIILPLSAIIILTVISITVSGCHKPKPDCGCDSKTIKMIPDSASITGRIGYKKQIDPNDNFYNNKFWLIYTDTTFCSVCRTSFILCNEDIR
jgi:hypothetical protein